MRQDHRNPTLTLWQPRPYDLLGASYHHRGKTAPTMLVMVAYRKGTTPASEMERMQEAFASVCAAIQAWPDPSEAWRSITELQDLIKRINGETADFRGWIAFYLKGFYGWSDQQLADHLGLSRPAITTLIKRAREKGNPVTNPTSAPIQPALVLAIITGDQGVLVEHRIDKIPPWTFPGGDALPGESLDTAIKRIVLKETGLNVTETTYIDARVHPSTSRYTIYAHAQIPEGATPELLDLEDLDEVKWASIDETRETMRNMHGPVRGYLDQLQQAQRQG